MCELSNEDSEGKHLGLDGFTRRADREAPIGFSADSRSEQPSGQGECSFPPSHKPAHFTAAGSPEVRRPPRIEAKEQTPPSVAGISVGLSLRGAYTKLRSSDIFN